MSNTFEQWQNKEITDIECIRNLKSDNDKMNKMLVQIAHTKGIKMVMQKNIRDLLREVD